MGKNFTPKFKKVINHAVSIAAELKVNEKSVKLILLTLLSNYEYSDGASIILSITEDQGERLHNDLVELIKKSDVAEGEYEKLIEQTHEAAQRMGQQYIGVDHLCLGVLEYGDEDTEELLDRHGISLSSVRQSLIAKLNGDDEENILIAATDENEVEKEETKKNFISQFCINFSSKEGVCAIGRDGEVKRCLNVLRRMEKNNPVLIGEAGVGKTHIAQHIASLLTDKELWALDMGLLVAGTKYRGAFETRIKGIIDEVKESNGKIILFIDELHTIVGAGSGEGTLDASNILKPPLARGEINCIGATTVDEYAKIEKDPALDRRFQPVMIEEPDKEQVLEIGMGAKHKYEKYHGVLFNEKIIKTIIDLSDKYLPDRNFPDKFFDLMDETGASVNKEENYLITKDDVLNVVSEWSKVDVDRLKNNENVDFESVRERFLSINSVRKVAAKSLSEGVTELRSPFANKERPFSFLFFGEQQFQREAYVKAVSEILFGKERVLSLNMQDFNDQGDINKLIGSPPGYIDSETKGRLDYLKKYPATVVWLRNFTKASQNVINLFLSGLEDGYIENSLGSKILLNNCVFILDGIKKSGEGKALGFLNESQENEAPKPLVDKAILSQINKTVYFENFNEEGILTQILEELAKIFYERGKVVVKWDEATLNKYKGAANPKMSIRNDLICLWSKNKKSKILDLSLSISED